MPSSTHVLRRRVAAVALTMALASGVGVATSTSASAAATYSACMAPYQRAYVAMQRSEKVSNLIFQIGSANCHAEFADKASARGDDTMWIHHYNKWRVHYANAAYVGGQIAIDAWKALAKQGIKKGLRGL